MQNGEVTFFFLRFLFLNPSEPLKEFPFSVGFFLVEETLWAIFPPHFTNYYEVREIFAQESRIRFPAIKFLPLISLETVEEKWKIWYNFFSCKVDSLRYARTHVYNRDEWRI